MCRGTRFLEVCSNITAASCYATQAINKISDSLNIIADNQKKIQALKKLASNLETRKSDILTAFYITGRIDGLYFGRSSKSKRNHVKEYIKGCLYKNRINDMSLIEDCYNTAFLELYKKPAQQIVTMYEETPAKLLATTLRIIALKCFAVDPRYNNPNHSLIQSILFGSICAGAISVDRTEEYKEQIMFGDNLLDVDNRKEQTTILKQDDEPNDFVNKYGFDVEAIVERLTPEERLAFYDVIGNKPKGRNFETIVCKPVGKTPGSKLVTRAALFDRIRQIKEELK
jgi:hypothetical protein